MKRSVYDIAANVFCLILLIGTVVYLAVRWNSIPDLIPGHYDAAGNVNRWGGKGELLIVPIVNWLMYIGITFIERFPQIWNTGVQITPENKERVYRILKNMIGTLKVVMVAGFATITYYSSASMNLPLWFLPVFMILMFGSIVLFIIKLIKAK